MGGSSKPQTTTQTNDPWKEQKPYLQRGFSEAGRLYDQGPAQYYPGQTYADLSDPSKAGLTAQTGIASGPNQVIDNAAGYTSSVLGGGSDNPYAGLLQTGAEGLGATARGENLTGNPYLDMAYDSASKRVRRDFEDTALPGIAAQFGQGGMAGSTPHELAAGKASQGFTDTLGTLAANIYGGNYQQERDRQASAQQGLTTTGAGLYGQGVEERIKALGLAPGIREAQFGDAGKLREAGGEYERQREKVIEDDIKRFNYGQTSDVSALQDYLSMISGNYGGTSVSRTSAPKGSGLSTVLGAGASLASLLSDRRAKSHIKHVATTSDGLKIYSFRYKGDNVTHVGLIAQEVQEKYPDAVHTTDGFLRVDYAEALKHSVLEAT